ncbi:hypothetical protein FPZ42_00850 [Mucilaginibacter achroorhodeus]|uniref:Uncharacterized protein n=1 Tax=Mucilaginibacter achroorhodeus TaxID=2599294 RepID=A0A563U8Y2_9SPHI|nr:hypothetical protein [Mucilaginibacter achroorhodeus]TWR27794.1 hypothetical protein FPZ42_00850 [Mucilaginibacter achroorhodeus]
MKNLQNVFCSMMLIVACTLMSTKVKAQSTSGIYLSADDFVNHKLSYTTEAETHHIRFNGLFDWSTIKIDENGKPVHLRKNEIFGYRLNGTDYRFFKNTAYKIIADKGIYLYAAYQLEPGTRGMKRVEDFYFSQKPDTTIRPLTMTNLETCFQNDTQFLYALEGFFRSDKQLADYDNKLHEYKLEYIYGQTVK